MEDMALVLAEDEGLLVMSRMGMKYLKAIWLFCSYLFVPQWGKILRAEV